MSFQIKKFDSIVASMINWGSGVTDKITDWNVGSVTRTILEAVAIELEELYYQLLEAVEEAIEEAIYRTFNFTRNPSEKATGEVRFYRLTGTENTIAIPRGTLVGTDTDPSILFETTEDAEIAYITGAATGGSNSTLIDTSKDFINEGVVASSSDSSGSKVINVSTGSQTTEAGVTSISQSVPGGNYDTLHFTLITGDFTSGNSYKVIAPYVDASVRALVAGTEGNCSADSITVLKSSISNVTSVKNTSAISTGRGEETSEERKARFALYIQSLARATKGALEYAARTVPEVISARAIDDVRPNTIKYVNTSPTDITTSIRNPGDRPVVLFGSSSSSGTYADDALYIGAKELFDHVNVHLFTDGELAVPLIDPITGQYNLIWEYSQGGGYWGTLSGTSYMKLDTVTLTGTATGGSATQMIDTTVDPITGLPKNFVELGVQIGAKITNVDDAPTEQYTITNIVTTSNPYDTIEFASISYPFAGGKAYSIEAWEDGDGTMDFSATYPGPFTQSGVISFNPPEDWASYVLNTSTSGQGILRLWIRCRIVASGTVYSTLPTGDYFSLPPGLGYVYLYCHDGSGELNSTMQASVESAVEPYRGCGIIVDVRGPSKYIPTITGELLIAENYDTDLMAEVVVQALKDWLNSKTLGEDLYLSELYQFIMNVNDKAIINCTLTAPTEDKYLSSSQIMRADETRITITAENVA